MNTIKFKTEDKAILINPKSKVIAKETAYHCKICDKYYASYKSYGNHTRSYHGKNKEKSKCLYCGNSFTRRDNLQQHIKLFHTGIDKQFVCALCGEVFVCRSSCMKHQEKCVKRTENNEHDEANKKCMQHIAPSNETRKIKNHLSNCKLENDMVNDYQQKINNGLNCDYGDCEMYTLHKDSHKTLQTNDQATHIFISNNNYVSKASDVYPERRVLQYTQRYQYIDNTVEQYSTSLKHNLLGDNKVEQYSTSLKHNLLGDNENGHLSEHLSEVNNFTCDQENRQIKSKEIFDVNNGEVTFESYDNVSEALDCTNCNITFLTRHDYDNHKPFCEGKASLH